MRISDLGARGRSVCQTFHALGYARALFGDGLGLGRLYTSGVVMSGRSSWLLVAAFLASSGVADHALAQGNPRVAVLEVQGPQARKVQGYIEGALRGEVELVDAGDASAPSSNTGFADLAQNLDVQAVIVARVEKSRRFVVTVTVRQGRDGSLVGSATWAEKKAPRLSVIQRELWAKLGSAIETAEGPAAAEPTPAPATPSRNRPTRAESAPDEDAEERGEEDEEVAEEDEAAEADESDSGAPSTRRPALRLELGFGPMWRDQSYNDTARLPPARYFNEMGSPAMTLALAGTFYPAALFSDSMLGNLGLTLGFGSALGLSSADDAGTEFGTSATTFHIGLRARVPVGLSEFGLTLAYAGRNFIVDAPAATEIPDVRHRFLRIAGDGHIALSDTFGLELNLGYLVRLSTDELDGAEYFPQLSGGGFEAGVAAVMAIGDSGLSVRLGLDWQQIGRAHV